MTHNRTDGFFKLLLCAACAAFMLSSYSFAQDTAPIEPQISVVPPSGGLLVAPTRLVLEGRDRAGEIRLSNQGNKEETYRIRFKSLTMDEKGQYHEAKAEDADTAPPAEELLRFSPKQVTLKPGETQVVKLMLRKTADLPAGEYRSHMLFQTMPEAATGESVEPKAASQGITIRLLPMMGVTIPVIVRHGALEASSAITNAKLSGDTLNFSLTREGSRSTYGDILVTQGSRVIGEQRGVAVFTPNRRRDIHMELNQFSRTQPMHIAYRAREEDGGKPLAETTLTP